MKKSIIQLITVLIIVCFTCAIIFLVFMWNNGDRIFGLNQTSNQDNNTYSREELMAIMKIPCINWDEINIRHKWEIVCVEGVIAEISYGDLGTYIIFSPNPYAFFLILPKQNGTYFADKDLTIGDRIMTKGVVEIKNGLPYMLVRDEYYFLDK